MQRDKSTIIDILHAAKNIVDFVEGLTYDEFSEDTKTRSAVLHQAMIVGEAVKRLSEEYRENHEQVPWDNMAGLRDVLIHQYNSVDYREIWNVATGELPEIIQKLEELAPEPPENTAQ